MASERSLLPRTSWRLVESSGLNCPHSPGSVLLPRLLSLSNLSPPLTRSWKHTQSGRVRMRERMRPNRKISFEKLGHRGQNNVSSSDHIVSTFPTRQVALGSFSNLHHLVPCGHSHRFELVVFSIVHFNIVQLETTLHFNRSNFSLDLGRCHLTSLFETAVTFSKLASATT